MHRRHCGGLASSWRVFGSYLRTSFSLPLPLDVFPPRLVSSVRDRPVAVTCVSDFSTYRLLALPLCWETFVTRALFCTLWNSAVPMSVAYSAGNTTLLAPVYRLRGCVFLLPAFVIIESTPALHLQLIRLWQLFT